MFSFVRLSINMVSRCPLACPQKPSQAFWILNQPREESHLFLENLIVLRDLSERKKKRKNPKLIPRHMHSMDGVDPFVPMSTPSIKH